MYHPEKSSSFLNLMAISLKSSSLVTVCALALVLHHQSSGPTDHSTNSRNRRRGFLFLWLLLPLLRLELSKVDHANLALLQTLNVSRNLRTSDEHGGSGRAEVQSDLVLILGKRRVEDNVQCLGRGRGDGEGSNVVFGGGAEGGLEEIVGCETEFFEVEQLAERAGRVLGVVEGEDEHGGGSRGLGGFGLEQELG